jgi:hypothetical protein
MNKDKFVDFLIFTSVFVSSIVFFTQPFEGYLHYVIFLMLFPFFIKKYGLPKTPFQIVLIPFFVGIFQIFMGNNEWFLFFKIFFGVILSTSFYYYVIQYYDMDIEKMFNLYLKGAYFCASLTIVQYVSFRIGFSPGYNFEWLLNKGGNAYGEDGAVRLSSIFTEPSQLGIVLGPAAFVSMINIFRRREYYYENYQNYIILIALYLSKSSTGYIGLFFIILIIGLNLGYISYLILFIAIGVFGVSVLYNSVDEFKSRTDAALGLWVHQDFNIKNVNTSSFVQYNNAHVAFDNFKEHPLFGTGMGSHQVAYSKYSYTKSVVKIKGFDNNSADANSLFLRLMSETGLMGLLFIIIIVFKCFVGNDGIDDKHWIISGAILILILLYLLRQGNYFLNGFPFFVWLYYYNKKAYLENKNLPKGEEIIS